MTANEPFYAIQYLSKNRKTNWYVAQSNDGTVVFKYEPYNTSKFYLFQFGNFYGTATTAAEVKDWTSYALYSHSVRADGVYGSNTSGRRRASAVFSFLFISDKSAGSVGVRG